jgi:hypothetical protein
MTNETQEKIEREEAKGLVGKIAGVGRRIFGIREISYETQDTQISCTPERTEETERNLQKLFKETPLYQILEEQQKQSPDYHRRTSLNQFADLVRTDNLRKAFSQISKPVKEAYSYNPDRVIFKENVDFTGGTNDFVGASNDFYGLNPSAIRLDSIKLADVSIVAGRLARKIDEDPSHYYKIASLALDDASLNMGMAMAHIGAERLGKEILANMEKASEEISRREQIIGRELGRGY